MPWHTRGFRGHSVESALPLHLYVGSQELSRVFRLVCLPSKCLVLPLVPDASALSLPKNERIIHTAADKRCLFVLKVIYK